jgi:hypothetical protein
LRQAANAKRAAGRNTDAIGASPAPHKNELYFR